MTATRKGVAKRPPGRPSKLTQALADRICLQLAEGRSLREICRADGMPAISTVLRWQEGKSPLALKFRSQYARAREQQAHVLVAEIIEIADDGTNDWMERQVKGGAIILVANDEAVQRSKLRVDARKWAASKLLPKVYGDKITTEVSGPDAGPIGLKVEAEVKLRLGEGLAALRAKLPA